MKKKWFLLLFICALLAVSLVLAAFFLVIPGLLSREYVGGKYQCSIQITGQDPRGFQTGRIFYVKNGTEHKGYWGANMRDTLSWIRDNTPVDAVFLNWWDYGHMIVGFSERESTSKNPSQEALISVLNPNDFQELDSHTIIVDVAKALTTTNENETLATMTKYDATYLLVAAVDGKGKAGWLFNFAGLNYSDYYNFSWQPTNLPFDPDQYNELGKQTVICRILTNVSVSGLAKVYGDGNFTICRRTE